MHMQQNSVHHGHLIHNIILAVSPAEWNEQTTENNFEDATFFFLGFE